MRKQLELDEGDGVPHSLADSKPERNKREQASSFIPHPSALSPHPSALSPHPSSFHLPVQIRKANDSDFEAIWSIFQPIVQNGDSYSYDPEMTRDQAYAIWMAAEISTYVACLDGQVVGTYVLKANQSGPGSHVANAGYMVKAGCEGQGVGRAMCEHSLSEARQAGFMAMQFNMVVSTNEAAVSLWKKMGFTIVGTLPKAFRHRRLGLVDAYVMHRFL